MSINILLDSLPETVTVDGKEYFLDTDFRTCIIFEKLTNDNSINSSEKIHSIIDLFFTDEQPANVESAVKEILHFYNCNTSENIPERKIKKNGDVEIKPKMIYDYDYDAPYIFAAFFSQYGVDLNEIEYLHWWKFQAMFKGLNDNHKIVEIMSYRATDLNSISNKKERARIAKLQRIYAIPDNLTFEEKVARAGASFGGGFG